MWTARCRPTRRWFPASATSSARAARLPARRTCWVFPDLQAGNIGYKLVQRLGNAKAIGPVIQGLAKPVNDLSRGCSVEDIVDVVAIAAVKAQA